LKSALWFIARVGISFALLWWLWSRLDGGIERLGDVDPLRLWPAVLIFAVSTALGALQWMILLRSGGVQIGFPRALRLYWIGLFCNNLLPSNVGGDVVKIADVAVSEGTLLRPAAATLLDRLLGLLALVLYALVAGAILGGRAPAGVPWWLLVLAGAPVPIALALLLSRRLAALVASWIRRFGQDERFLALARELEAYRLQPRVLFGVLGLALVVQFLRVGTHMVVARELGLGFSLERGLEFLVLIPLLALAIVLPISFGGLGLREWVATRLMPQIGITAESAVVLQLSTYLVQVAVSLVGGVLFVAELARGRLLRRRNA